MTESNMPLAPAESTETQPAPEMSIPSTPSEPPVTNPDFDVSGPTLPDAGPLPLPTPALPSTPSTPSVPSIPAIPSVPSRPTPSVPSRPARPTVRVCPSGYRRGTVQNNQSFTDLLIENNVSYNAMRSANPNLPTTRLAPGTVYCAPPSGSRRLCPSGSRSYVMNEGDTLYTLARALGISSGRLLVANPSLAPGDFIPGRVICLP